MDKNKTIMRNEADDETPKQPDESASASAPHGSDETPKQSTQTGSPLLPLQESPSRKEDCPKRTGLIHTKKDLRTSYLEALKATLGSTSKQSAQINKTRSMDLQDPLDSVLPKCESRLPVFKYLCSGKPFPWHGTETDEESVFCYHQNPGGDVSGSKHNFPCVIELFVSKTSKSRQ
ncbi:uncharacterized protein LOC111832577 [Capsella rubella]|uniref:uncharacterized protein LOC111832577 n=1 Tax=Capsella rubella TaxID=81985 RepID=UPI000CD4F7C3|nr:uncharacterized protein LOC111832577 [Capsella rubella]